MTENNTNWAKTAAVSFVFTEKGSSVSARTQNQILVWVLGGLHIPERAQQAEVSICEVEKPSQIPMVYDFGKSIRRHSIVDEQSTKRLGWIMGGV